MKPKNVLTVVLLLFVAASVAVLAAKRMRRNPQEAETPADGVVAYYFHGNARCPKCRNIEACAREAVQSGFRGQLTDGQIEWRVVNFERPENEHFATDYELITPTVVLVEFSGGSRTKWKDLHRVWQLEGDKEAFVEYVQRETRDFMKKPES